MSESMLHPVSAEGALDDAAEAPLVQPPAGVIGPLGAKTTVNQGGTKTPT